MKIFLLLLLYFSTMYAAEIQYYEDKNLSYTNENILMNENFSSYNKENSNFGMSKSTYWLKLVFENNTTEESNKILNFSYPLLDELTLYKLQNNRLMESQKIGNLVPKKEFSTIEPNLSLHLRLDVNRQTTYYIKVKSEVPMNLDMNIYTPEEFTNYKIIWFSSITFYVGAVLMVLLYNLILYFFIRVRAYLYYVLFHTTFLLLVVILNGTFIQFVYPQNPEISTFVIPLMITLTASLQILFVYEFLEINKYGNFSKKLMLGIMSYATLAFIIILFIPYRESILLANTVSVTGLLVPLGVAVYYWIKLKNTSAKYYVIAWLLITLGILIEHLKNSGLIETNFFTTNAMQMGAIIELLMISLALAYRFNQLRDQNVKLSTMVITDSMTKIKNRLYFLERMNSLINILKRRNEDHALIMLDIDHFKSINDNFGHAVGDKVLIEFSKKITSLLREEDLFARIGGEEFVILVRLNREDVIKLTNRINQSIEEMKIVSKKGDINFTVSIGITLFNDGFRAVDALLKEADEALYSAKKKGRNRVEFFVKKN